MSTEYKGQNPLDIAKQAEADLNSRPNVQGRDPNTARDPTTTIPKHGARVSDSGTSYPVRTSKLLTDCLQHASLVSMSLQSTGFLVPQS